MTTDSSPRSYLAAHFPFLPAERVRRSNGAPPDAPFAFVEKVRGAMRLAAVDRAALALGIEPGLTLADARARIPDLVVVDHAPALDRALLDRVADDCDRWTPMVAVDPPQGLVLDITGFVQDGASLAADLDRRLTRAGLAASLAFGPTPDAAAALARHGGGKVPQLPVTALRVAPETHVALRRAGLTTIADLAALAAAPLAARFGAELPVLLARLLGEEDVRITPRRALPAVMAEARFAEPVAVTQHALDILGQLVAEAAVELGQRDGGGRRFEATLFRSDGHVARLAIETGTPTRDPAVLDRLFRERIDTLADPLDPGFGYDLIRLAVPVIEPLAPHQLELEGGAVAEVELAALIDRLGTRLGRGRVRCLGLADTHIPEQVSLDLPPALDRAPALWPSVGEPPLRPLHLFDPPQRIEVTAEVPDGPPRRFKWRRRLHEVIRYEGPERIATEWWRRRDNAGLTRDYYRIEDARGRRYWVFRHGLYGVERAHPEWFLHGLFA